MKKQFLSDWGVSDDKINQAQVEYLDAASSFEGSQMYKRQSFDLLKIKQGHHILDVGCGTGEDVRTLSGLVGSSGLVVGVDSSEFIINTARERTEGTDLPAEYHTGDAGELEFKDNTFDACRADRILMHVKDPERVLTEMMRVAKFGGRLVVSEPDWETLVINTPEKELTRNILNFRCDLFPSGWIGRQLPGLFKEIGLKNRVIIPVTGFFDDYRAADRFMRLSEAAGKAQEAGVVSANDASSWLKSLEEINQEGRFFASASLFTVAGRKPLTDRKFLEKCCIA